MLRRDGTSRILAEVSVRRSCLELGAINAETLFRRFAVALTDMIAKSGARARPAASRHPERYPRGS